MNAKSGIFIYLVVIFISASLVNGCRSSTPPEANPLEVLLPYQPMENFETSPFNEPSGIVFLAERGTLFVVGDEGQIAELRPDGTMVKNGQGLKNDYEGITYAPSTGLLYLVTEQKAHIFEVSPDDFTISREFTIAPNLGETAILNEDQNKIEAIAFVPKPDHPEGGVFFLATQAGDGEGQSSSLLFSAEAPLKSNAAKESAARILAYANVPVPDLSGLHYDPTSTNLYAISDWANVFLELTEQGQVVQIRTLPGEHQEGITLDNQGYLYLAQDSGGIIKLRPMNGNPAQE